MDDAINLVNMDLIDMDCIHVVPNSAQLPNRDIIERLFPKCSTSQHDVAENQQQPRPTPASPKTTAAQRRRRRARVRKAKAAAARLQQQKQPNGQADSQPEGPQQVSESIVRRVDVDQLSDNRADGRLTDSEQPAASEIASNVTTNDNERDSDKSAASGSWAKRNGVKAASRNPSPVVTRVPLAVVPSTSADHFGSLASEESEIEELMVNGSDDNQEPADEPKIGAEATNGTSTADGTQTSKADASTSPISAMIAMFPRLDDGLSDEADSGDDLLAPDDDEDDERAGEADADDEDDELLRPSTSHHAAARNGIVTGTNVLLINGDSNGVATSGSKIVKSTTSILSQKLSFKEEPEQNKKPVTPSSSNNASRSRQSSDTELETDRFLGSQRAGAAEERVGAGNLGTNHLLGASDSALTFNGSTNGHQSSTGSETQPSALQNNSSSLNSSSSSKQNSNYREVLIEGVLFNVKYLGSTHTECEGRGEREDRIHQAEMAVHEVKLRNNANNAAEVHLFISTEKIMVLDDKNGKLLMDHSLRTISYIADIGDAIVLIVRTKTSNSNSSTSETNRLVSSRISCHVFESSESHTITKSISQAFQVAYTELLKANGIGDGSGYQPKELDYQQVLNSQEMSTEELEMFARRENEREVIVPKQKNERIGLSIVESGWGSVLPTVVIANIKQDGPADKCKKLSVGDQILSVNGVSLVGLPLADCQEILRRTKTQTVARLSVVPCPITVEVKIKRPDTKYQLGFSVQNGVICSLLRGGIAERGGVRVGHRIMSINGTTVVGAPHDKIVTMLASSVGEIRMKTCLTSLYKLILGEEKPVYF